MKAITALTDEEYVKYADMYKALRDATQGMKRSDLFEDFTRGLGYAHYKFSGIVSDKLIELLGRMPTGEEIIMLVDDGFSHFGASCSLSGKRFSGRVNTD